jgi:sensor histidine kinase YesM
MQRSRSNYTNSIICCIMATLPHKRDHATTPKELHIRYNATFSKNERWWLENIVIVLGISVLANFVYGTQEGNFTIFCKNYIYSLTYSATLWIGNISLIGTIRKRFPGVENTFIRMITQLVLGMLLATICVLFMNYPVKYVLQDEQVSVNELSKSLQTCLIMTYVVMSIYEAVYFFQNWKKAVEETQVLLQLQLKAQLTQLKAQLNPHFLFNNFNTLAAVIDECPIRAQQMVHELAHYYRYILRADEHELSTIEQELESVEAYGWLLKIRYEDIFRLEIEVSPIWNQLQIPTLTLQMLLENAAKHNRISTEEPLLVRIRCTDQGILRIENTLQAKSSSNFPASGLGLLNLTKRFELLGFSLPVVKQTYGNLGGKLCSIFQVEIQLPPLRLYEELKQDRRATVSEGIPAKIIRAGSPLAGGIRA